MLASRVWVWQTKTRYLVSRSLTVAMTMALPMATLVAVTPTLALHIHDREQKKVSETIYTIFPWHTHSFEYGTRCCSLGMVYVCMHAWCACISYAESGAYVRARHTCSLLMLMLNGWMDGWMDVFQRLVVVECVVNSKSYCFHCHFICHSTHMQINRGWLRRTHSNTNTHAYITCMSK